MRRDRSRFPVPFFVAAGLVATALVLGGWVGVLVAFIALLLALDRLVPDFHTPLFSASLPADKRERLKADRSRHR